MSQQAVDETEKQVFTTSQFEPPEKETSGENNIGDNEVNNKLIQLDAIQNERIIVPSPNQKVNKIIPIEFSKDQDEYIKIETTRQNPQTQNTQNINQYQYQEQKVKKSRHESEMNSNQMVNINQSKNYEKSSLTQKSLDQQAQKQRLYDFDETTNEDLRFFYENFGRKKKKLVGQQKNLLNKEALDNQQKADMPESMINSQQNQNEQMEAGQNNELQQLASDQKQSKKFLKKTSNGNEKQSHQFAKPGQCHLCKKKNKFVYGCYKNWQATSCNKMFCLDCMTGVFKENILLIVIKNQTWHCPYKRKICKCKHCTGDDEEEFEPPEYLTEKDIKKLFGEPIPPDKQKISGNDSSVVMKALLKQKFKKQIEFNGQLIQKLFSTMNNLNKDEMTFFNKLVYQNLLVLSNLANYLNDRGKIVEE